jgi:hypothetical protein
MLKISPFGGMLPRVGTRVLPEDGAQVANNIKLKSGEIRPLREPALINSPAKPMPALTVFRGRDGENNAWFTWPQDVDVIRVPLSAEVESRFVWTGDGIPKIATYSDATDGGGNDYPKNCFALGIPAPATGPTVAPSGGVGAATTRIYTYTFFSALGEESAPAPPSDLITGKVDDTWAISGMDAIPPNSGDITNVTYVGKSVTITTTNRHYNRVGEDVTIAGVTTVTNVNGTWALTAINAAAKTMTFTVTGTPAGAYVNATDTADTWARTVNFNTAGMKRRLYRSTGNNGTVQLVADDVGTSFNDAISDADILGDELISGSWAQPPVGLKGVKVHPSGSVIGFVENILCMSEPYQPHAWPAEYELATDRDIVGVSVFGSDIGVGTKGNPWVASGIEPASMAFEKIPGMYPCLSKRSLIGYGDGLIYATAHGMVFAGRSGVSIITEAFYGKDEWHALNPESMVCSTAYGRLYVAFQRRDGSRSMLILDGSVLITADVPSYSLYTDDTTGELFVTDTIGINAWDDADTYPLSASWRSKDFVLAYPVNMGAAKIEFDMAIDPATQAAITAAIEAAEAANSALLLTGNIEGSMNSFGYNENGVHATSLQDIPDNPPSNLINFILRKNEDEIVISRMVSSNTPFRLPKGYKADTFSVEVFSQCRIKEIRIAETMEGLRNA